MNGDIGKKLIKLSCRIIAINYTLAIVNRSVWGEKWKKSFCDSAIVKSINSINKICAIVCCSRHRIKSTKVLKSNASNL